MLLSTLLTLQLVGSSPYSSNPKAEAVYATVQKYALQYNLDPHLVQAIIETESNFNIKAVGRSHGEVGLMQLRPKYFPKAKFDVETNIREGVKYLAYVQKICQSRYGDAWFVCYNVGPNRVLKHPTKHVYYRKVYGNYKGERRQSSYAALY